VDSARVSGMAVEQYFNLCLAMGASSVTTGAFPDTLRVRLDRLGERDLLLPERERQAAMAIGSDIRQRLFKAGYCVLQANAPVRVGGAKVGEHDLVVDLPCCPRGVAGRFSVEVKLRRVTGERHLQSLRATLQDEAWLRVKSPDGSYGPHWWQSVSTRGHWAGRILVFVELPKEKAQLAPYVVRAEQRLLGPDAQWEPLFGWPRRPSVAPKAAPRAAPKAAPKALPRAPPQRMTWAAFKPLCGPWKQHCGASVAPVKKFLKKAVKPPHKLRPLGHVLERQFAAWPTPWSALLQRRSQLLRPRWQSTCWGQEAACCKRRGSVVDICNVINVGVKDADHMRSVMLKKEVGVVRARLAGRDMNRRADSSPIHMYLYI
jgi:hypothetical protein